MGGLSSGGRVGELSSEGVGVDVSILKGQPCCPFIANGGPITARPTFKCQYYSMAKKGGQTKALFHKVKKALIKVLSS